MTNSEENKFNVINLIADAQAANDKLQKLIGELMAYQTMEAQVWQQITEDRKPVFIREASEHEINTDELNLEDEKDELAQSWGIPPELQYHWKKQAAVVLRFESTEKELLESTEKELRLNLYYVPKTEKNQGLLEAQRMAVNGTRAVMQQVFSALKEADQARGEALFMFNDICTNRNKAAFAKCWEYFPVMLGVEDFEKLDQACDLAGDFIKSAIK